MQLGEVPRPFPATNKLENMPAQEVESSNASEFVANTSRKVGNEAEGNPAPIGTPSVPIGIDKFEVYHHVVNGYPKYKYNIIYQTFALFMFYIFIFELH